MTSPSESAVVAVREDFRNDGPMTGDERSVLDHWLDLYRETLLLKIAGLDAAQLVRRAVPPSSMSLLGVVRHLTEVEASCGCIPPLSRQSPATDDRPPHS